MNTKLIILTFSSFVLPVFAASESCACLSREASGILNDPRYDVEGDCFRFEDNGNTYCFPLSYGLDECKAHDQGLEPFCNKIGFPGNPDWCGQQWCWVDEKSCDVDSYDSSFFPDSGLHYSYRTCGSSNTFTTWIGDGVPRSFTDLVTLVERYVVGVKTTVEQEVTNIQSFSSNSQNANLECTPSNSCSCSSQCSEQNCWDEEVNFFSSNLALTTARQRELSAASVNFVKCAANTISSQYLQISGKEYNDENRIAYQYYGDQGTGGMVQWPEVEFCNEEFDARFRPWYAAAASGPKDIVIVVDTSGSMSGSRMQLAIEAIQAVVRTLTWVDYFSIITFNSQVNKVFSQTLIPATEENVERAKEWADSLRASGGTDFDSPIAAAYQLLKQGKNSDDRSTCSQAILFMTDGQASFSTQDFQTLVDDQPNVVVFSYSLGADAAKEPLQEMACRTSGIYYPVDEAATLPEQMSSYYKYFVRLQPTCKVAWIKYSDSVTNTPLVAGCSALFDYNADDAPGFIGVTCQDLNTIVSLDQLMSCTSGGYELFMEQVKREAQQCPTPNDSGANGKISDACTLRRLRAAVSASSLCPADSSVSADCSFPVSPSNSTCSSLNPNRFDKITLDGCSAAEEGECQGEEEGEEEGEGGVPIGAAVGGGIAAVIVVCLFICCFKGKTGKQNAKTEKPTNSSPPPAQQASASTGGQENDGIPIAEAVPVKLTKL